MVEIFGQLVKFKICRDAIHRPRFGVRFKRAQQHFARVLFVVRTFVGYAQHGHLCQTGDRFGHDIEVFAGVQRHVHAQHAADFMAPHAATVDDHFTGDVARLITLFPIHAGNTASLACDTGGAGALNDACTALSRAFGQRQRDVGGVALTVFFQEHRAGDAVDVQVFVFCLDLRRADFFDRDTKGPRHRRLAVDLFLAFFGQCNRN